MRRYWAIVTMALVATALVGAVASPAQAKTVDVDDWAGGFCDVLSEWESKASKARDLVDDVIDNGVSSSAKARAARSRIMSALDDASEASTTASKDVKALGSPAVANGAKITSTIASAIGDTSEAFSDAKDDVAKAPTDPKKFQSYIADIKEQVDRELEKAGEEIGSLESLQKGTKLDTAFENSATCDAVTNS
jgi:hypothetical protein